MEAAAKAQLKKCRRSLQAGAGISGGQLMGGVSIEPPSCALVFTLVQGPRRDRGATNRRGHSAESAYVLALFDRFLVDSNKCFEQDQ